MTATNLTRWSGMAAIVGAVFLLIVTAVEFVAYGDASMSSALANSLWVPATVLSLVAIALTTLSLVGLYAHQSSKAGSFGLVAFLVAFAGMLMTFGFTWLGAFLLPPLAAGYPSVFAAFFDINPPGILSAGFIITLLLLDLGWLLFGVASLRARVFPRGAAIVMIIGAVLDFIFGLLDVSIGINGIAGMVLVASVAWMGIALWSEKSM